MTGELKIISDFHYKIYSGEIVISEDGWENKYIKRKEFILDTLFTAMHSVYLESYGVSIYGKKYVECLNRCSINEALAVIEHIKNNLKIEA